MTVALMLMGAVLLIFGSLIYSLGGIEIFLTMIFPYTDIYRDGTGDIYLRRFFIYPRDKDFGKNKGKGRVYLHKFYRGDEDPHFHDHPWPFTSLILTTGYYEETPILEAGDNPEYISDAEFLSSEIVDGTGDSSLPITWRRRIFYAPWTLLRRPAVWKHRVILKEGKPAWTLVKTGVKERSWGFWTDDTSSVDFCPWRQYDDGVCYCTPEEKDANHSQANLLHE